MRPTSEHGSRFWLALTVSLLAAGVAQAQSEPIAFDVQVVHGSNHEGKGVVDPACNEIKARLPVQFNSLQMVTHRQMKLKFGESGRVDLPTGRNFTLMPISIVRDRLHVHFQIKDLVDTRLQLRSGRPVIVGGQAWDDGKLIIMLKPAFKAPSSPAPAKGPRLHRVGQ